jgi:hypothetical protein
MQYIIASEVGHVVEVSVVVGVVTVLRRTLEVPMKNHLAVVDAVPSIVDHPARVGRVVDLMVHR